jgi:ferredoxin-thioredoxin reductase catalytic chain
MSARDSDMKERIDALYRKLNADASASGYHLNPDEAFTRSLVKGLLVNIDRFGYMSCPCRLAAGERRKDIDIICPCYYRDPDLTEWGACYCALYVSEEILAGRREAVPIPERRPPEEKRNEPPKATTPARAESDGTKVWRCKVCGYLCSRDEPPERCPICKAARDRFEAFPLG